MYSELLSFVRCVFFKRHHGFKVTHSYVKRHQSHCRWQLSCHSVTKSSLPLTSAPPLPHTSASLTGAF